MATPFDSRVQNVVYQLEVGVGARILKAFLYVLFMTLLALLFVANQYVGFHNARAMDQAQLARNFSRSGELNTQVVRPAVMRHLREKGKPVNPTRPPDTVNAPVYPMVLGAAFKVFGVEFPQPTRSRYAPEQWVVVPLNLLWCFLAGLFLYLMGLRLFDPRVALTAATVYFLSGGVWSHAVGGTELSLALFLATFGFWCLLRTIREGNAPGSAVWRVLVPAVFCAVALWLLFLTRYAAGVLIPGVLLVLFLGLRKRGWVPALVVVAVVAGGTAPWVARNLKVTGEPFGHAPSLALHQQQYDLNLRSLTPLENEEFAVARQAAVRGLDLLDSVFTLRNVGFGAGVVFCLFVATYFYSFRRGEVRHLRWGVLLSFLLLLVASGVFGVDNLEVASVFVPVVLLYGTAFFYLLLDRMQIGVRIVSLAVIALFVLVQSIPLVRAMMPPKPSSYPPYHARDIGFVTRPFEPGELFCSDMPWATAWYGDQLSLYLPASLAEFYRYHDDIQPVNALYFTLRTRDLPYHSALFRGPYRSWRPIMELSQLPRGFPLTTTLPPLRGGEQILLADRNRWQSR